MAASFARYSSEGQESSCRGYLLVQARLFRSQQVRAGGRTLELDESGAKQLIIGSVCGYIPLGEYCYVVVMYIDKSRIIE